VESGVWGVVHISFHVHLGVESVRACDYEKKGTVALVIHCQIG
jgi:hypothetical protein